MKLNRIAIIPARSGSIRIKEKNKKKIQINKINSKQIRKNVKLF